MKVVDGKQSENHCNQSDTLSSIHVNIRLRVLLPFPISLSLSHTHTPYTPCLCTAFKTSLSFFTSFFESWSSKITAWLIFELLFPVYMLILTGKPLQITGYCKPCETGHRSTNGVCKLLIRYPVPRATGTHSARCPRQVKKVSWQDQKPLGHRVSHNLAFCHYVFSKIMFFLQLFSFLSLSLSFFLFFFCQIYSV